MPDNKPKYHDPLFAPKIKPKQKLTPEKEQSIFKEGFQKSMQVVNASLLANDFIEKHLKPQQEKERLQGEQPASSYDGIDREVSPIKQPKMAGDNPTLMSGLLNTIGIEPESQDKLGESISRIGDNFKDEISFVKGITSNNPVESAINTAPLVEKLTKPVEVLKTVNNTIEATMLPLEAGNILAEQNPFTDFMAKNVNKVFEAYDNLQNQTYEYERNGQQPPEQLKEAQAEFDKLRKNVEMLMLGEGIGRAFKLRMKPLSDKMGITDPAKIIANDGNMYSQKTIEKFANEYEIKAGKIEEAILKKEIPKTGEPLTPEQIIELKSALPELEAKAKEFKDLLPKEEIKPNETTTPKNTVGNKPVEETKQVEPYELTKAEFEKEAKYHGQPTDAEYHSGYYTENPWMAYVYGDRFGKPYEVTYNLLSDFKDSPDFLVNSLVNDRTKIPKARGKIPREAVDNPHKYIIEEALKEGKTVPDNVLKDYPDLVEKYKTTDKTEIVKQFETVDKDLAEVIKNNDFTPEEMTALKEVLPKPKRIISDEVYTKAKENIFKTPDKISSNPVDFYAEKLKDLTTIGAYHIENGLRDFGSWSKKMIEEVGERVKPYLGELFEKSKKEQSDYFRDGHRAPTADNRPFQEKLDGGGDYSLLEVAKGEHNQPSDYFDSRVGARYYGYDDLAGKQSLSAIDNIIRSVKADTLGDKTITTYRAVPKDIKVRKLQNSDWVTFSKEYAKSHGEHRFGEGEYKIIKQEVKPSEVWWDGNDINEWGYDNGKIAKSIKPESYQQAVKNIRNRGSQINSNPFDPTVFKDIYTIGKFHIEQGLKNFSEWSRKIVQDIGRWVQPHLQKIWTEINKDRTGLKDVVTQGISPDNKSQLTPFEQIIQKATESGLIDKKKAEELVQRVKMSNLPKIKEGSKPQELPSINLEKINSTDDLKTLIEKTAEGYKGEINKQRRETITNAETKAFAQSIGLTEKDIMGLKAGDILNSENTYAARDVWINAGNELVDFVKSLPEQLTAEQQLQLKEKMMKFKAVQKGLAGLRSEAGRLLQQWNIPADGESAMLNRLNSQLKRIGEGDGDILAKLEKMQKALEPSFLDKVYYWWYNSILSSPLTDMANIIGNSSNLGFEAVTSIISDPLSTGKVLKGVRRGVVEGLRDVKRIAKMEEESVSKFDFNDRQQLRRYEFTPTSKFGGVARALLPLTRLQMEDAFFRRVFEGMKSEVLTDKLSKKYKEPIDVVEKNIIDVMNNPMMLDPKSVEYRQVMKGLNDFVDYGVFQQPLGQGGQAVMRLGQLPYVKPIIPFIRIAANIMKAGFKTTPLGLTKLLGKDFRDMPQGLAKNMLRKDVIRRAVAGSIVYTGLIKLVGDGTINITGSGAESEAKRDLLEKDGLKPNHIYWKNDKGEWTGFSYQNINPFNIPLALIGNYLDDQKYNAKKKESEYDLVQKGTATMFGFAETLTDQSFLSGVNDLVNAIKYKNPNYLKGFVTNLITPNVLGAPKNISETIKGKKPQYEADTFFENLKKKVGLTEGMREKKDVFGDQKNSPYERFPFPFSSTGKDPVSKYLIDNNITVSVPDKETKINGSKMSPEEYSKFKTDSGRLIKQLLTDNLSKLKTLNVEEADKTVEDITRIVRDKVKESMGNKGTQKKTYSKQYEELKGQIKSQFSKITK